MSVHLLQPGDEVVAKYSGFRGKSDNPWFAGTVEAVNGDRCTIQYEDGDRSEDVMEDEVMYAPGRHARWGKGQHRGNDMLPSPCTPVTFAHKQDSSTKMSSSETLASNQTLANFWLGKSLA